jgi:peptidoglycan/LPS O-acetylase OafA/YrhL
MLGKSTGSPEYLPYIDGLRALAVLSVIAYHLNHEWLPGGFSGVDVFFVISGFVVSASMDRQGNLNLIRFAMRFYSRRIRRIVPALMVCLLFSSFLSTLFIPNSWLSDTNDKTGLYAFFGLSNLILFQTNDDYFSPRTDFNPYTHTWSLGVEEQFYLIFPLLFFLWVAGKGNKRKYASTLVFSILTVLSLILAWWFSKRDATFAYYMIFTRFWELAFGVILYQISSQFPSVLSSFSPSWRKTGVAASLGLVLFGFIFANTDHFPFPWALFPVLGTAGLLFFLRYHDHSFILNSLSNSWVTFIGRISYSLYLWHWPIIVLFRWTVGIDSIDDYITVLLLTFLLATGSYYFIELPFRYSPIFRTLPETCIVLAGLALVAVSYFAGYTIFKNKWQWSLSVTKDRALWYPGSSQWKTNKSDCPLHINNIMVQGNILHKISPKCNDREIKTRLFAVGDSHTGAYYSMLKRLSMEMGIEVLIYTTGGCSYISLSYSRSTSTAYCQQFYKAVSDDIKIRAQPGDILFLSSLRLVRLGAQSASLPQDIIRARMSNKDADKRRAFAVQEAIDLLKPFQDKGIKVVFEAPKPIFRAPAFRCSDWFNKNNPICLPGLEMRRSDLLEYRKPVMESFEKIAQQAPGIHIWDPFPILCPGETCKTSVDGKPLFFDGDHISGYGNMFLYDDFRKFINKLLENPTALSVSKKWM